MITSRVSQQEPKLLYPLPSKFWEADVVQLAQKLINKRLIRIISNELLVLRIVETEAYHQSEPSCHAYKGKTNRNAPLFASPGFSYVYFTYGMYHCLNVTAEPEGVGAAVLIRALEPIVPIFPHRMFSGPGLICKHLKLNRFQHNMIDLKKPNRQLWLSDSFDNTNFEIIATRRIGIRLATELNWRFYLKDNKSVSRINKKPEK